MVLQKLNVVTLTDDTRMLGNIDVSIFTFMNVSETF